MGVCNCSMFCCTLLYVHSSIANILMGKRELVALLNLFSWCLVMVERLFLAVPRGCLRFVIVVFPDHTRLLFYMFYEIESFGVLCVCGVLCVFIFLASQNRLYYKVCTIHRVNNNVPSQTNSISVKVCSITKQKY